MSQHETGVFALVLRLRGYVPIMTMLANLIRTVAAIIAAILVAGILLVVLNANEGNSVVNAILDAGRFFQDPFGRMFDLERGKEHLQIAINWGLTAVIYAAVGAALGALLLLGTRRGDRTAV